jgi:hypothetical protein
VNCGPAIEAGSHWHLVMLGWVRNRVANEMKSGLSRRAMLLSGGAAALSILAKSGNFEVGVCGSLDDFAKADRWGFDYFEPSAAAVAAINDGDFADFRRQVLASRLRCKSFNSLIRTLQVVGPNVDLEAVTAYLNSTLDRCSQLGAGIVVWGCAGGVLAGSRLAADYDLSEARR